MSVDTIDAPSTAASTCCEEAHQCQPRMHGAIRGWGILRAACPPGRPLRLPQPPRASPGGT
eukprot:9436793-Pyramimonas_sp.AAC.1